MCEYISIQVFGMLEGGHQGSALIAVGERLYELPDASNWVIMTRFDLERHPPLLSHNLTVDNGVSCPNASHADFKPFLSKVPTYRPAQPLLIRHRLAP